MLHTELLERVFGDAQDLVVILRPDRRVAAYNPAFARAVPEASEGVDFLELVAREARTPALAQLVRAAAGESVRLTLVHGPGAEATQDYEYTFFPVDGGLVAGFGRPLLGERTTRAELDRTRRELKVKSRMLDEIQLELTQVPFVDPATGVWNRIQVFERLASEWSRCERFQSPVAVLLVDLEGLDEVRHGKGAALADDLLKAAARRIKATVRDHDVVGRYGRDCFVVVGVQSDLEGARSLAARIQAAFAEDPLAADGETHPVRPRIGGATNRSAGVEILEDLFQVAEAALGEARRASAALHLAAEGGA